ncbi:MAG: AsmA family protein [Rickettsiaceae bacterium H1]|nr:AsmA family protein [Rickettsiaceae bacterium H1]
MFLISNSIIFNKILPKLKFLIAILITLAIIYFSLQIISKYVINWNSYENEIVNQLEKSFGKGSVNISHLDGSLLMPKINAYNFYLNNGNNTTKDILVIPKIEMKISLLSMIFFKPKVKSLNIESVNFKLTHIKNLALLTNNAQQKIQAININNGNIILDSYLFKDIKFEKLSILLGNESSITSNIIIENRYYKAMLNFNDTEQNFSLTSDLFEAKFNGKKSKGTLNINGSNLANNIGNVIKPISFNSKLWDKFTISTNISWSPDNLKIDNFQLTDDNIAMSFNFEKIHSNNQTNLKLTVDKINLDNLIDGKKTNNFSLLDLQQYLEGDKDNNSSGKILIEANEITYNKKEIDNIKFNSTISGKLLKINQCTFDIPGNTTVNVMGKILNNSIISKFDGNISLISKDPKTLLAWGLRIEKDTPGKILNFNSNISITPQAFSLNNIMFEMDGVTAESKIFIKKYLKEREIKGELKLENLNLNDFKLYENVKNTSFYQIKDKLDLNLDIRNISYKENIFDKFSLKLLSDTGTLLLKNIKFDSKSLKANGNTTLVNKGIERSVYANINIDYINSKILGLSSILDINYDPDLPQVKWSSTPISWFGLDKLNGQILTQIKKLDTQNFELNNLNIDLSLKNKVLSINKFKGEIDKDSNLDITANIGMDSESSALFSFVLNNINLPKISKNIFNIDAIAEGKISSVGSIKSKGNNINKLIENLEGKMQLASRNIIVKNFDIDQLFRKIPNITSNSELATLTKVLIYSNETNFKYLDGLINIKNGIMANTLKFKTNISSGVLSSHLSLQNFNTNSVIRFFFVNSNDESKVLSVDMNINGPVWLPKISFDNNKIHNMIIENTA